MDNNTSSEITPEQMLAIQHRVAALKAIRTVSLIGIPTLSIIGIINGNWYGIPISIVTAWIMSIIISNHAANKVQKLTGLSHRDQAWVWEQYKSLVRLAKITEN